MHTLVKVATAAGLIGLVVLHPDAFGKVFTGVLSTFNSAVKLT